MRIAVLADVHGNPIALEAVLADIEARGGVDRYWLLGDYAALGHDPVGALTRLTDLPRARFVRGNTDRLTALGLPYDEALAVLAEEPDRRRAVLEMAGGFGWTAGAVAQGGYLAWLAELPLEWRTTLPDGTRVLPVHAAPGTDDGDGVHPEQNDDELRALLEPALADLVLVGHTHWPLDRTVGGVRVVNPGSVSNPMIPGLRASYAVLSVSEDGYALEQLQVDFNRDAVLDELASSSNPSSAYIASFMRGERTPHWMPDAL